jgi:transposase
MQLPGVGFIVAMTVLAAIGDISRFENAKQLVGYAGIGAGVDFVWEQEKLEATRTRNA